MLLVNLKLYVSQKALTAFPQHNQRSVVQLKMKQTQLYSSRWRAEKREAKAGICRWTSNL